MDKQKKDQPKANSGLKSRMEDFYLEMTFPDGKTVKVGSRQEPLK